jgi:hypothetical protein
MAVARTRRFDLEALYQKAHHKIIYLREGGGKIDK